jgi:hypothetical protein
MQTIAWVDVAEADGRHVVEERHQVALADVQLPGARSLTRRIVRDFALPMATATET